MKIAGFIQARLSSKRLPKKVMRKIGPYTLLEHIILRLKNIKEIKKSIYLLVPYEDEQYFSDIAKKHNIKIILGDEYDVLSRFAKACEFSPINYCIRLTADNPFVDVKAIKIGINYLQQYNQNYEIALLSLKGLPIGMGAEFISSNSLFISKIYSKLPHHREHVTTYIKENSNIFNIHHLYINSDNIASQIRLTIDENSDLELAREVFEILTNHTKCSIYFGYECIKKLYYKSPDLFLKNIHIKQRKTTHYEVHSSNFPKTHKL